MCPRMRYASDKLEVVVESKPFNIIVILLIVANAILLALEYDHMPQRMSRVINTGN
jgi:hypothetical protein